MHAHLPEQQVLRGRIRGERGRGGTGTGVAAGASAVAAARDAARGVARRQGPGGGRRTFRELAVDAAESKRSLRGLVDQLTGAPVGPQLVVTAAATPVALNLNFLHPFPFSSPRSRSPLELKCDRCDVTAESQSEQVAGSRSRVHRREERRVSHRVSHTHDV